MDFLSVANGWSDNVSTGASSACFKLSSHRSGTTGAGHPIYCGSPAYLSSHRKSEQNMLNLRPWHLGVIVTLAIGCCVSTVCAEPLPMTLRYQVETSAQSGRYHRLTRDEAWDPAQTAIIVCDMWDAHHCYRAVQREMEFCSAAESDVDRAAVNKVSRSFMRRAAA